MLRLILFTILLSTSSAHAGHYLCAFTWQGKNEPHALQIEVSKNEAIIKDGTLLSPST